MSDSQTTQEVYLIKDVHPTQMSVGMLEVKRKIKHIQEIKHDKAKLKAYMQSRPIPGVLGPNKVFYIIDHHHLARAMHETGVVKATCQILADYSDLSRASFWRTMDDRKWVYPFDEHGHGPYPYDALPKHVKHLKDDPYRSLAGAVRKQGGYTKTTQPFQEFRWADFLRPRVPATALHKADFDEAVQIALQLARSSAAVSLPGHVTQ